MNIFRRRKPTEEVESGAGHDPAKMGASTAEEYLKRGLIYHAHGEHEKAEADLKQAVSLDPDLVDAYYNLGLVYRAMGRSDDAAAAFKQAQEKLPVLEKTDPVRAMLVGRILKWQIRQAEDE